METRIDHLVIGAASLEQGVAYVHETLGVDIPKGGVHLKMGTHNHLMQLGDGTFLEVIALHPWIKAPLTPRWYGLDDPFVRRQITQQPVLLTWVANTRDIKSFMQAAAISFGKAQRINRDDLSWDIGLPEDGRLLASGMLPYVIQWHSETHPSQNMADRGCRLLRLDIFHPRFDWLKSALQSIDALKLVTVHPLSQNETPYLLATINTPVGVQQLRSRS